VVEAWNWVEDREERVDLWAEATNPRDRAELDGLRATLELFVYEAYAKHQSNLMREPVDPIDPSPPAARAQRGKDDHDPLH
jgi:hypothetical protein